MYPPRKESDAMRQPPSEVRYWSILGGVALCLAALAKFANGPGSFFLTLGIGACLRAAMFRAGFKSKTQTIVVCGLGTVALAVYYIARQ